MTRTRFKVEQVDKRDKSLEVGEELGRREERRLAKARTKMRSPEENEEKGRKVGCRR